ncbi:hypothetical protein P43SY_003428 [Pythium insidiosum]|uniref:Heparan-alpha-glucosaminide N-acetyltransferase catalytic domain-containing protein n=1 Tax=Pythium insidiosum TaxID=114742 RepID=A0AAD5LLB1_PYTIN|nr:hypothetical protein P43SY_003428 [Pythium insidiosum]
MAPLWPSGICGGFPPFDNGSFMVRVTECAVQLNCSVALADAPTSLSFVERALPIVLCLGIIVFCVRRTHALVSKTRPTSRQEDSLTAPLLPPTRCVAIDVFRGLTMCLMIFVNYGGGGLHVFKHSTWDGLTIADVVFPWYAELKCAYDPADPRPSTVALRASRLFGLGLFLNNGSSWRQWRIPGVLQGLSVAFALVALLSTTIERRCKPIIRDSALRHVALGILPMVVINLAFTYALPVPGCPTGYVGPGGSSHGGAYRDCTGGAHLYIDMLVFGRDHLFQSPTCQQEYDTGPFDPEGLLNWLMMAVTTYLGWLSARVHLREMDEVVQLKTLVVRGGALAVVSICVSGCLWGSKSPAIPINKNLWSLSFVGLTSGLASIALAANMALLSKYRIPWDILSRVGRNAIFLYAMHEIMEPFFPFSARAVDNVDVMFHVSTALLLLHNAAALAWWVFVAVFLHDRGLFITV